MGAIYLAIECLYWLNQSSQNGYETEMLPRARGIWISYLLENGVLFEPDQQRRLVSRKLCAHLETSKPDMENIVPAMSLSRYCGRRLELIVTCIMVAWNIVRNLSVRINGVNFNRLSVPTLHNRKPKSLPNNQINTKPKSIYKLTITLQSAENNRSDQPDFIFF